MDNRLLSSAHSVLFPAFAIRCFCGGMQDLVRIFCPAFLALTTISHTRALILCFDFQCLSIFSLMFLVDPDPYVRVYFLFYVAFFTLPTAYIVVFGDRIWMRLAFICQLTRLVFISLHNVFYPIFVAALVASDHPKSKETSTEEILMKATSYGVLIFFMSLVASIWEPAKLYQIYRLMYMLEPFSTQEPEVEITIDNYEDAETYQSEVSDETSDSGCDAAIDV